MKISTLVRYFRDQNVSRWKKAAVIFAVLYVLSPVDAIPDVVPLIGWLDDIGVLSLLAAGLWKSVGHYEMATQNASRPAKERGFLKRV